MEPKLLIRFSIKLESTLDLGLNVAAEDIYEAIKMVEELYPTYVIRSLVREGSIYAKQEVININKE